MIDWNNEIEEFLVLADKLPTGRFDLKASIKLAKEWQEFEEETDFVEKVLEAADIL